MNACTTCGACCASFRVDFSVQELEDAGGSVPVGLAVVPQSIVDETVQADRGLGLGRQAVAQQHGACEQGTTEGRQCRLCGKLFGMALHQ